MGCFHPLEAYQSLRPKSNGKTQIVFKKPTDAHMYSTIKLPCGRCIGCRLQRSGDWAVRCTHEASLHQDNAFITLTYNDKHLPTNGSLQVKDFQLFMKRLRKHFSPKKIRFFHCGEYGETFGRPHYHACLFGIDFDDKFYAGKNNGVPYYGSETLAKIWGQGFVSIGEVNFQTAAYVARYIMKKINGDQAHDHYTRMSNYVDDSTGEIIPLKPEYTTMSRKPGLAKGWFDEYKTDIYPSDQVVIKKGDEFISVRPPRFYDNQFEIDAPKEFSLLKAKRKHAAKKYTDNSPERLAVKETVCKSKLKQLKRGLPC